VRPAKFAARGLTDAAMRVGAMRFST